MKVFLLYEMNNPALASRANTIKSLLENSGAEVFDKSSSNVRSDIFESRYLIILAESLDSFIRLDDDWRYFINEIRWKRKIEGEVIILASESVEKRRIPFALKSYRIESFENTSWINELNLTDEDKSESAPVKIQVQEKKIKQENACKDAHIFENDIHVKPENELKAKLEQRKRELSERFIQDAINKKAQSHEPKIENKSNEINHKRIEQLKRQQNEEINRNTNVAISPINEEKTKSYKGDPFPDYPHTPDKEELRNAKVGCGVGIFFVVFFFIVLVSALSNI